ncbi:hypothetical protein [Spirosoma sp.]|uniref:hypothetical protein n=1 Tax=Spirosoma sp. TaxID=1899569 RepID=UPI003B3A47C9
MSDKSRQHVAAKIPQSYLILTPFIGLATFIGLYLLATLLYPGGSQANQHSLGFSWLHNYWCNLLNPLAIDGQPNAARPLAVLAMLVLCVSLASFWYLLPTLFAFSRPINTLIQGAGILSMLLTSLIFTPYHDLVINVAGLFSLIALSYTFRGLYQHHYRRLFWFGLGCLGLIGCNNYIYYSQHYLYYLPLLQKITFGCFLGCIGVLNWNVFNKVNFADEGR